MNKLEKMNKLYEEYGRLLVQQEIIQNRINRVRIEINNELNKEEQNEQNKEEQNEQNGTKEK